MIRKIKVGDRVVARWTHGEGVRGTVTGVQEWTEEHKYYTETHCFVDIQLDNGHLANRPAQMVELESENDGFWVKD